MTCQGRVSNLSVTCQCPSGPVSGMSVACQDLSVAFNCQSGPVHGMLVACQDLSVACQGLSVA